jgi:hypothetical protein
MRKQKILNRVARSTSCIQAVLNFFVDAISICWSRSQIYYFTDFWSYGLTIFVLWFLSYILFTRLEHTSTPSFLSIYF